MRSLGAFAAILAPPALANPIQSPGLAGCVPLPRGPAVTLDSAWAAYRSNRMTRADSAFREVLSQCPREAGALSGLAYVAMRQGAIDDARGFFARALVEAPNAYDPLTGMGMAAYRQGDTKSARETFRRAAVLFPKDSLVRWYLSRLPDSFSDVKLPPARRSAVLRVDARTGRRVFEIPDGRGKWSPIWLKGVNIGAALPGKHPSEFPPDDGTYEKWLALAAEMGSNVIRVYTIHPPHFYRAVEKWNLAHPTAPLWVIHGVWTELPPGDLEENYDDPAWRGDFRSEARRVVDLLHGHAVIEPKPGHSAGVYTADISRWVIAYIIGREWEPYSIVAFSEAHPSLTAYQGRYLQISGGNATEVWLTEECDYLLKYEVDTYNAIRPVAYTNWPTLDPLTHPTESTGKEEKLLRKWALPETPREFDNDAIGLDAVKMRVTAANPAGVVRVIPCLSVLPRLPGARPGLCQSALARRGQQLLRLSPRAGRAPRRHAGDDLGVRGSFFAGQRARTAPGMESRWSLGNRAGRDQRPPDAGHPRLRRRRGGDLRNDR